MKVRVNNEWEHTTYWLGKRQLSKGDKVRVAWPDGSFTEARLGGETRTANYSDHGHSHSVTSDRLFIQERLRGVPVRVELTDVELVWVVDS